MKTKAIISIIFALVILINSELRSQTKKDPEFITVQMNISLNGAHKKDTAYHINIKNLSSNEEKTIHTSNRTSLHLDYNTKYEVTIAHIGYDSKIVEFDTEAPIEKWIIMTDVNLDSKKQTTVYAGIITFDKETKTFKSVKKS